MCSTPFLQNMGNLVKPSLIQNHNTSYSQGYSAGLNTAHINNPIIGQSNPSNQQVVATQQTKPRFSFKTPFGINQTNSNSETGLNAGL